LSATPVSPWYGATGRPLSAHMLLAKGAPPTVAPGLETEGNQGEVL
jgi:hypothetical protein